MFILVSIFIFSGWKLDVSRLFLFLKNKLVIVLCLYEFAVYSSRTLTTYSNISDGNLQSIIVPRYGCVRCAMIDWTMPSIQTFDSLVVECCQQQTSLCVFRGWKCSSICFFVFANDMLYFYGIRLYDWLLCPLKNVFGNIRSAG